MLVICGSHVRTMELMLTHQSPLFGRLTGQWRLQLLPFGALRAFFFTWSPEQQVALYAMLGGSVSIPYIALTEIRESRTIVRRCTGNRLVNLNKAGHHATTSIAGRT